MAADPSRGPPRGEDQEISLRRERTSSFWPSVMITLANDVRARRTIADVKEAKSPSRRRRCVVTQASPDSSTCLRWRDAAGVDAHRHALTAGDFWGTRREKCGRLVARGAVLRDSGAADALEANSPPASAKITQSRAPSGGRAWPVRARGVIT